MGVVQSEDYETWYTSYMRAIRHWSNCPTEFFPRFPYLSAHHQIWESSKYCCISLRYLLLTLLFMALR